MLSKDQDEEHEVFINLTPMIDILTCLLFFLLLGYKSQTASVEAAKNIILPQSSSDKGFVATLAILVTQTDIKLEGSHVMFLKNGELSKTDLDGARIVPLYNRLVRYKNSMPKDPEKAIVLLLADKRLKSDVVTMVMKTSGMAGLPNFHFGVARP